MTRAAVDGFGQTVVMVTHDPRAASYADRVVFLADGRIVQEIATPTMDEILDALKRLGAEVTPCSASPSRASLAKKRRLFSTGAGGHARHRLPGRHAGVHRHDPAHVRRPLRRHLRRHRHLRALVDERRDGLRRRRSAAASPSRSLATVADVDGVADAQGLVAGFAQIVGADGDAIGNPGQGAPTFAHELRRRRAEPVAAHRAAAAPGPGELVVDKGSADKGDLDIGDTVTVLTQTGPHEFPLVGTARFGSVDSPGGASVVDLRPGHGAAGAARPARRDRRRDGRRRPTASTRRTLTAPHRRRPPRRRRGADRHEITEETQDAMHEGLGFFNTFLLVFAAIGLVVACFTIYNTFQIVVTQRRGRWRCCGRSVRPAARCCPPSCSRPSSSAWSRRRSGWLAGVARGRAAQGDDGAVRDRHPRRRHGVAARTAVVALGRRDARHHRLGGVPVAAGLAGPAARRAPRRRRRRHRATHRPPPPAGGALSASAVAGASSPGSPGPGIALGRPRRAARSSSACSCSDR